MILYVLDLFTLMYMYTIKMYPFVHRRATISIYYIMSMCVHRYNGSELVNKEKTSGGKIRARAYITHYYIIVIALKKKKNYIILLLLYAH